MWQDLTDIVPAISVLIALLVLLGQLLRDRREHHRRQLQRDQANNMRDIMQFISELREKLLELGDQFEQPTTPGSSRSIEKPSIAHNCSSLASDLLKSLREANRNGLREYLLGTHPISDRRLLYHGMRQRLYNKFTAALAKLEAGDKIDEEVWHTCSHGLVRLAHSCLLYDTATFQNELAGFISPSQSRLPTKLKDIRPPRGRFHRAVRWWTRVLTRRPGSGMTRDKADANEATPYLLTITNEEEMVHTSKKHPSARIQREQEQLYEPLIAAWEYLAQEDGQKALTRFAELWNVSYEILSPGIIFQQGAEIRASHQPRSPGYTAQLGQSSPASLSRFFGLSDLQFRRHCKRLAETLSILEAAGFRSTLARCDTNDADLNDHRNKNWDAFTSLLASASHNSGLRTALRTSLRATAPPPVALSIASANTARFMRNAVACMVASSIESADRVHSAVLSLKSESRCSIEDESLSRAFKCIGFTSQSYLGQTPDISSLAKTVREKREDRQIDDLPPDLRHSWREYDNLKPLHSIAPQLASECAIATLSSTETIASLRTVFDRRWFRHSRPGVRSRSSVDLGTDGVTSAASTSTGIQVAIADDVRMLLYELSRIGPTLLRHRELRPAKPRRLDQIIASLNSNLKAADLDGLSGTLKSEHPLGHSELTEALWRRFRNALRELHDVPPEPQHHRNYVGEDFLLGLVRLAERCFQSPGMRPDAYISTSVPLKLSDHAWNYTVPRFGSIATAGGELTSDIAECVAETLQAMRVLEYSYERERTLPAELCHNLTQSAGTLESKLDAADTGGSSYGLSSMHPTGDHDLTALLWAAFRLALRDTSPQVLETFGLHSDGALDLHMGLIRLAHRCSQLPGISPELGEALHVRPAMCDRAWNYLYSTNRSAVELEDRVVFKIGRSVPLLFQTIRHISKSLNKGRPPCQDALDETKLLVEELYECLEVADRTTLSDVLRVIHPDELTIRETHDALGAAITDLLWNEFRLAVAGLYISSGQVKAEQYLDPHFVYGLMRLSEGCEYFGFDRLDIPDALHTHAWNYLYMKDFEHSILIDQIMQKISEYSLDIYDNMEVLTGKLSNHEVVSQVDILPLFWAFRLLRETLEIFWYSDFFVSLKDTHPSGDQAVTDRMWDLFYSKFTHLDLDSAEDACLEKFIDDDLAYGIIRLAKRSAELTSTPIPFLSDDLLQESWNYRAEFEID